MLTLATIALAFIALGFIALYKLINAPATYGKGSTLRAMQRAYPNHWASLRNIRENSGK